MAQTQLYTKKAQVAVNEEEIAQDTYEAPEAGDCFMAEIPDVPLTFVDADNYRPTTVRGDFLSQDEVIGPALAQIAFRVPVKGSGTAGTAPEWGEAIKACGYEETSVPATSVAYNPFLIFNGTGGNPGASYSVAVFEDGVRYAIKGAFGNVVFEAADPGEPMFMSFTFTGAYVATAAVALLSPTYDTTIAPSFRGASFAVNFGGSYTPKGVRSFTLDTGNNVVGMKDVNDSMGYYGSRITGRDSFGSFEPEMVAVGTHDYYGKWRAGTAGTITTGLVGSTAGNRYTLAVARSVLRPIAQVNRDQVRALTVPFAVSSAATDVEGTTADITLTLT